MSCFPGRSTVRLTALLVGHLPGFQLSSGFHVARYSNIRITIHLYQSKAYCQKRGSTHLRSSSTPRGRRPCGREGRRVVHRCSIHPELSVWWREMKSTILCTKFLAHDEHWAGCVVWYKCGAGRGEVGRPERPWPPSEADWPTIVMLVPHGLMP